MNVEKEGVLPSLFREIYALSTLKHENIVELYEIVVGKHIDKIFLVMEYCDQVNFFSYGFLIEVLNLWRTQRAGFIQNICKIILKFILNFLNFLRIFF